jgi:hypothetical protein
LAQKPLGPVGRHAKVEWQSQTSVFVDNPIDRLLKRDLSALFQR